MGIREREIRRTANEVLEELGLLVPPIDPAAVARQKGLRFDERPGFPEGIYGILYKDAQGFGILISEGCHGRGHRAFTIAHELGHYHIDGHIDEMFPEGAGQIPSVGGGFRSQKSPLEREADWFASELVMPEPLAGPVSRDLPPSLENIDMLARKFSVSRSCAAVRYVDLTDTPVALVLSRNGEIEWLAVSERMREHPWSRKAWKKEWVPKETATQRLATDPRRVGSGGREEGEPLLCEWFHGAPPNLVAEEASVGLGSWGRVLTLLAAPGLPSADEIEEERAADWRPRDWRDAIRGYSLD